jgi:hypothetical protein
MLRDRGQSRPPASRPIRFSTLVASRRPSDDCRAGAAGLFHFAGGHQADVPACFHEQRFASPYGDDSSAADKVRNVRQHFCEDKIWSFLQILLRRRGYVVKTEIAQWQDRHSVGADVDAKRRSVPFGGEISITPAVRALSDM